MAPASTIFARLPLFFASLLGPIVNEDPTCIGKGGFTSTCAFPGLYFNQTSVGMYCLNDQYHIYGYNWTWLDLNTCLTNDMGQLTPMANGNYSDTCTNCTVAHNVSISSVHIACECQDRGLEYVPTSIDLNSIVYNSDGSMGCCDMLGNKTWKGPQADA